jgi:hypothetical protein
MPTRLRGLLITIGSALASWGLLLLLQWAAPPRVHKGAALPLVGVLWGLLELVSGVPLPELAERWETLSKGVQGALSFLVIMLALGVFVLVIRII